MSGGKTENKFPENFKFGFSSSAYQIEGAWKDDGKGENIWDRFTHDHSDQIKDGSNGDVACDFFNRYKEDIKLMKDIGVKVYRFSLSWSRILPTGFNSEINTAGIDFYKSVLDELLSNNIEPIVTLYHWDLPQPLQDLGGWTNPALADCFADYAEVAFKNFGDKVQKWITFNEPEAHVYLGYAFGTHAPGMALPGVAEYLAAHTILKAHARAFQVYDKNFRSKQKGEIGISLNMVWKEPRTNSAKDVEAANESLEFQVGWFAHPIFSDKGDYPEVMKKKVGEESKRQGQSRSRLPELERSLINLLKGSGDFLGLNYYTTRYASHKDSVLPEGDVKVESQSHDCETVLSVSQEWEQANSWLYVVPWGLRKTLKWIKDNYGSPKIYITENGVSDEGTLDDKSRVAYYHSHLTEVLKSINEDECKVSIYAAWTLTDNFEWDQGYTQRFGCYQVDFRDPAKKRTAKKSVKYLTEVYTANALPADLQEYAVQASAPSPTGSTPAAQRGGD